MALEPYYRDGDVTLYHGDCLEHSNVWTSADALITDPPYGIALPVKSDKYHHNGFGKKQRGGVVANDQNLYVRDAAIAAWHEETRSRNLWQYSEHGGVRDHAKPGTGLSGIKTQTF